MSTTANQQPEQDTDEAPVDLFGEIKTLSAALSVMGLYEDSIGAPCISAAGEIGALIFHIASKGAKALDPQTIKERREAA